MNQNLRFAAVATVALFVIYYLEAWLEVQYPSLLSTSNFLGFILIALITAFGLFWVVKKAKAQPNI